LSIASSARRLSPGELLKLRSISRRDPAAAGPGWRALSEYYTERLAERCGRMGLTALIAPKAGEGHPGFYAPDAAKVILEGDLLRASPDQLRPHSRAADFHQLAVLHGVFVHEAGHADHSNFRLDAEPAVCRAAMLLEELRMEAAVVREHPADTRWLRAASQQIILDDLPDQIGSPSEAGQMATLTVGRVAAGSLRKNDVSRIEPMLGQVLDRATIDALGQIWSEAIALSDDEAAEGLVELGRRYLDLFPAEDQPGGQGVGGSGLSEAELREALEQDLIEAAEAAGEELDSEEIREQVEQMVGECAARAAISASEQAIADRRAGAPGGAAPAYGEREPSADERAARNRLARRLREARWRDRTITKRSNRMPPGRLRGREALRRSADRAQGKMTKAEPWRQRRRTHQELPKLSAAVLIDTSGSMAAAAEGISASLWVIANAVTDNGGKVAGITFGDSVEQVVNPLKPPRRVLAFKGRGGTAGVPETIEKATEALDWQSEDGPKLLVCVSDGYWGDAQASDQALEELIEKGVKVIQVGVGYDPAPHPADRTCVIAKPLDLAEVVGAEAVAALKEA
jgi:hypothetical protein